MPSKNKLANQMIEKHSLDAIPSPFNRTAIKAILEFAKLAQKHERKFIRALAKNHSKIGKTQTNNF